MPTPRKRRGRNGGWFKKGFDPRRRRGFTHEECRKGYRAAKAKMDQRSPSASAWFFRLVRAFYRRKRRQPKARRPSPQHLDPAAHEELPY
jgi:hypothetical protein